MDVALGAIYLIESSFEHPTNLSAHLSGDGPGSVRRRIDNWIADYAEQLAQQWDEEVIGLIEYHRGVLGCIREISRRLELQLGRDLQIVRMVGAGNRHPRLLLLTV